jgi:hypothetical protein
MIKCVLDLKANKVYPIAAIQTAAYTLLDTPIDFEAEWHIYYLPDCVSRLHSVTEILTAEGFIDTTWFNDYVRERGSNIHLACHLDDIGDLDEDTVGEVERPYLEAYRKFKRESGFVVEESEVPKANLQYRFAGTPDKIGHFPTGTLKRAALELHNDGTYKLIPFTDRREVNIWLCTLTIFNWKLNNLKRKG